MQTDPSPADASPIHAALSCRVGYLFARLHQRWGAASVSALREAGLGLSGAHFGALSVIELDGPMSQQTLGETIRKDRTTIVAVVDELEREGLVERHRNPSDRRAYALEVTGHGRSWLARAEPVLIAAEDELLAELDANEREQLVALLQRALPGSPATG